MKKIQFRSFAVIAAISFVLAGGWIGLGCERDNASQTQPSTGAQSLPTVKMKIGDRTFELEMAKTSDQQALGLMKRDSMPQDHGMIFTFAEERLLEFWMKDTRIPLDIMYLDARGKVVSVSLMQPYDLRSVSSDVPAQYAIELNAGVVKQVGIKSGDVLDIPAAARTSDKPPTSQP